MTALMVEQPDPKLLAERAQQGDRHAFEQLIDSQQERLRGFVTSRLKLYIGPRLEVDEILQDTFVRAFESIRRFEWQTDDSLFRWLCGIAKHAMMKAAEKLSREDRLEDAFDIPASGTSASRMLRRDERHGRLQQALDQLPPDYSQVVRLARIEGLKIDEIAERMNRSANSVKHLLARALLKLKDSFGDTGSLHLPDLPLRFQEDDDGEG